MKSLKVYLILFLAIMFIQCKEKTDQKNNANIELDKQLTTSNVQGTINVRVFNSSDNRGLGNVEIEIEKQGVSLGQLTTDPLGNASLTEVDSQTKYTFEKDNFNIQTIQFIEYAKIGKIHVHLSPAGNNSSKKHLRGEVQVNGRRESGVTVASGRETTQTLPNGDYSLDITSLDGTFPLSYIKGTDNGSIRMTTLEDTVTVDIFIDGFTTGGTTVDDNTEREQ